MNRAVEEALVRRFENETEIIAVWGLGSAFTGTMRVDSDLDLAVLCDSSFESDWERWGALILNLESIAGRAVDIGRLSTRSLIYAYQAVSTGRLLYSRDPQAVDRFVGLVFSLYADLKSDRKVVEEAYCAR